jgi:hypothetical protein
MGNIKRNNEPLYDDKHLLLTFSIMSVSVIFSHVWYYGMKIMKITKFLNCQRIIS